MYLSHHTRDPSHSEVAPADIVFTGLALRDITLNGRLPKTLVTRVDRKLAGVCWHFDIRMRQNEITNFSIQSETVGALTYRND